MTVEPYATRAARWPKTGRMTWIKPNFLWRMYRSGWGTMTLAVRLRRDAFDGLLASAVPSSFDRTRYADEAAWKRAVQGSDVRRQWDPNHSPTGGPLERCALQLGLRGDTLRQYSRAWVLGIEDIYPIAPQ